MAHRVAWIKAAIKGVEDRPEVLWLFKSSGELLWDERDEMYFDLKDVHWIEPDPTPGRALAEMQRFIAARWGAARHKADRGSPPWDFVASQIMALARDMKMDPRAVRRLWETLQQDRNGLSDALKYTQHGGELEGGSDEEMARKGEGPKEREAREMRERNMAQYGTTKGSTVAKARKPKVQDEQTIFVPVEFWNDEDDGTTYGMFLDAKTEEPLEGDDDYIELDHLRFVGEDGDYDKAAQRKKVRISKDAYEAEDEEIVYLPAEVWTDDGVYCYFLDRKTGEVLYDLDDEDDGMNFVPLKNKKFYTEDEMLGEEEEEPEPKKKTNGKTNGTKRGANGQKKGISEKGEDIWIKAKAHDSDDGLVGIITPNPDEDGVEVDGRQVTLSTTLWSKNRFVEGDFKTKAAKEITTLYLDAWGQTINAKQDDQPYMLLQHGLKTVAEKLELEINFADLDSLGQQKLEKIKAEIAEQEKKNKRKQAREKRAARSAAKNEADEATATVAAGEDFTETEEEEEDAPVQIDATSNAIKFANEEGVDLTEVRGTGPNGRVSKLDVQRYMDAATEPDEEEEEEKPKKKSPRKRQKAKA